MAAAIKLDDLNALLEAGRALDSLLKESPAIQAFAETMQQTKVPILVVDGDRLVPAGEAARLLGVNKSKISAFVKQGLLTPWYLPGSSARRFRLSEVWKIPRQEVAHG